MLQLLLFKITSIFLHAQFRGSQKVIYSLSDVICPILRLVDCVVCCESSFACDVDL